MAQRRRRRAAHQPAATRKGRALDRLARLRAGAGHVTRARVAAVDAAARLQTRAADIAPARPALHVLTGRLSGALDVARRTELAVDAIAARVIGVAEDVALVASGAGDGVVTATELAVDRACLLRRRARGAARRAAGVRSVTTRSIGRRFGRIDRTGDDAVAVVAYATVGARCGLVASVLIARVMDGAAGNEQHDRKPQLCWGAQYSRRECGVDR